jgi:SAM-dependent methyltransferase
MIASQESPPGNWLVAFLRRQSFRPSVLGALVNPFFLVRRSLFEHFRDLAPRLRGRVLDFGCGQKPYRACFTHAEAYVGLDTRAGGHDHSRSVVDVFYDGASVPIGDETFDAVFCSEVLEHIFEPGHTLSELHRVLRPNGSLLLSVPLCWNEHEAPFDYGRYTQFGIEHLLSRHGFAIVERRKSGHFVPVVLQLCSLYAYEALGAVRPRVLHRLLSLVLASPFNLLGLVLGALLPRNHSLYFSNVVLAEKVSPAPARN